jgi:hypothetical protein
MFAARPPDKLTNLLSYGGRRVNAPKNNPFLRLALRYSGYDLDMRLNWIVDGYIPLHRTWQPALARAPNRTLWFAHETFLGEYNPTLRKKYADMNFTPQPVVNFIVRAVDSILKPV